MFIIKLRSGFVSNSSSSSFIIASLKEVNSDRIYQSITESEPVGEKLGKFASDVAKYFVSRMQKIEESQFDYYSIPDDMRGLINDPYCWTLYEASISWWNESDDDYDKEIIRFFEDDIDEEDLKIKKMY